MTTTFHHTCTIDIESGVFEAEIKVTASFTQGNYDRPDEGDVDWTLYRLTEILEDGSEVPHDTMPEGVEDAIQSCVDHLDIDYYD